MAALRLVLCGAAGKMGRHIAALASKDPRFQLVACVDRSAGPAPVPGAPDCAAPDSLAEALKDADVVVDFSSPEASLAFAEAAAAAGKPSVIGTTGLSEAQSARLKELAGKTALLPSPNMSPGMNLLFELAAKAAEVLIGFDAAISETHHTAKKDAPSGSAKRLAEAVQRGRGGKDPVPTVSLRAGDVVGDHTLTLAGPGERLELVHRAHSREVFASGALRAALWIKGRGPGLYTMRDVLGLS